MSKISSRKIVITAMVAAVVFLVTWTVRIPIAGTSGGYVNLGDVVVTCRPTCSGGGCRRGGGRGSALATRRRAPFLHPGNLFIKGMMALTARRLCAGRSSRPYCFACLFGGALETGGYALYEMAVFGTAYASSPFPYT